MAPGSRLQELTAKYMQNPRRYFVPLANEYRQSNDLDRAIALCREHLPAQPGHMSGHIVLGRAYFEKGDIDAAREVFMTSVTLDDENSIALRHLGDIARLRGQPSEARQWYARVLDADPENAEIERLLRSLGGSSPTPLSAAAVMPGVPVSRPTPAGGILTTALRPPSTFELSDAAEALADPTPPGLRAIFGELPVAVPPAVVETPSPSPSLEILDASELDAASGTRDDDTEPLVVADQGGFPFDSLDDFATPDAPSVFVPADTLPPVAEADFSAGVETPAGLEALEAFDAGLGHVAAEPSAALPLIEADIEPEIPPAIEAEHAPVVEPQAPTAPADDLLSRPAFGALASFASWRTARERETPAAGQPVIPEPVVPPAPPALPYEDLAAGVLFDDDPPPVEAAATAPEFVTETMAQLYVQQGFLSQALDVYRELAQRAPGNPYLASRIAELESRIAAEAAPAVPAPFAGQSEAEIEADADSALTFGDPDVPVDGEAEPVSILELMYDAAPPVPVESRDAGPHVTPAGVAAVGDDDDWFADVAMDASDHGDPVVATTGIFGMAMDGFAVTSEPEAPAVESFDAALAAADAPATSIESVFGDGTVVAGADEVASDILVALAAQMVGRLPKELPALPVPDVLDLPTSLPGEDGTGGSPAPLLSFDRFFSGSGSPPRSRVDTPVAPPPVVPPQPAVPPQPLPSLSPTFGGVPVIPPPPPASPAWSGFDRPAAPEPVSPVAERRPSAPPVEPPRAAAAAPLPAWMLDDAPPRPITPPAALVIPEEPAAPEPAVPEVTAPAPAPEAAVEPEAARRAPPSEFHRWLEGLS